MVNIELGQTYLENNQDDNDDILQLEHLNQNETSQQRIITTKFNWLNLMQLKRVNFLQHVRVEI